jgi:hypothetical protein
VTCHNFGLPELPHFVVSIHYIRLDKENPVFITVFFWGQSFFVGFPDMKGTGKIPNPKFKTNPKLQIPMSKTLRSA